MRTMSEFAFDFLCKRNPFEDTEHREYVTRLVEFNKTLGNEAIVGLAGFYIFAIDHIEDQVKRTRAILQTFTHDLNGFQDKFFLPRSSGYKQFFEEEYYSHISH